MGGVRQARSTITARPDRAARARCAAGDATGSCGAARALPRHSSSHDSVACDRCARGRGRGPRARAAEAGWSPTSRDRVAEAPREIEQRARGVCRGVVFAYACPTAEPVIESSGELPSQSAALHGCVGRFAGGNSHRDDSRSPPTEVLARRGGQLPEWETGCGQGRVCPRLA
jgi:hypothetical protein